MPAYDEDSYAWAFEQARFLREGRFDLLDVEHLADEIESVAKEEVRELIKRMSCLLASLLEWSYLPAPRAVRCSALIEAQRLDVAYILEDSPSLRAEIDEPGTAAVIWSDTLAHAATGTRPDWLPPECQWSTDDVLSEGWLPANTSKLRRVDLRTFGLHIDATYIRVGEQGGRPIRYHRINIGRHKKSGKNKARARIARMALVTCLLAPDLVDTILSMPAGRLGRLVKAEVGRAQTLKHTRRLVKRRPVSTVFRVPEVSAEG